jgi:hypothetical protein
VLEKRGAGTEPSAACCSSGRLLQLGRDLVVRAPSRERTMPRAPVGIESRIGRLRQRPVDTAPSLGLSVSVDRRPNQRMPEHDPYAQTEEARALKLIGSAARNSKKVSSAPDEDRVTEGLSRSDQ